MTGELIINGKDAYQEWGVNMGENFLDSLEEPAGLKDYVTNSSRLNDGVDYCNVKPKTDERQLTLLFTITGSSTTDFALKKRAFFEIMYSADVIITVPVIGVLTKFHLKYKGTTGVYAQNVARTFCKVGFKFTEPNIRNRT